MDVVELGIRDIRDGQYVAYRQADGSWKVRTSGYRLVDVAWDIEGAVAVAKADINVVAA